MNKNETHHYGGGGYGELEAEAIEANVSRFISKQRMEQRMEEAGFDPRVVATIAEAETNQFDMQAGEYYTPQSTQK